MINIKRIFSITILLGMFFMVNMNAQKTNQFNKKGNRTGVWKKFYKNGKIRYQGEFKDGKEIGVFKFYSITSSTQPTIIKEFSLVNDLADVKFCTITGKLKSKGKMKGKNREGIWLYYFPDGKKIISEENYINGKLDGVLKNYYTNGKPTEETYYSQGKKHGTSKVYTEDGILIEDVSYEYGKLNGEGKYYDMKGNIKEKGNYKNGKRDGKWEFYMDGEIVSKKKKNKLSELKNK